MTTHDEIRHLQTGPEPNENPEGLGVVRFRVRCPCNSETVLDRCKEVLRIVLEQDAEHWPSDDEWLVLLPRWFIVECSENLSEQEVEKWHEWWRQLPAEKQARAAKEVRWSLANWIFWFQPDERQWFWWDSLIEDPNTLRIAVQVSSWPFPWGSLDWLLRASGATSVDPEAEL